MKKIIPLKIIRHIVVIITLSVITEENISDTLLLFSLFIEICFVAENEKPYVDRRFIYCIITKEKETAPYFSTPITLIKYGKDSRGKKKLNPLRIESEKKFSTSCLYSLLFNISSFDISFFNYLK